MEFDAALPPAHLAHVPEIARSAEALGFSALWTSETQHDPFLPAALVAEHTRQLSTGTAIAVSFARSPATLAYTAWDLAQYARGRFILGLGTQVKAHIERRFGMPWPESPANKLREQIAAIRAFWHTFQSGAPLNLRGEYYKLTLMTPFFNPGPIDFPDIPIYIAGVNRGLARLAGELADGFHVHPLHTPEYLRQVILPEISAGADRSQSPASRTQVSVTVFTWSTPQEKEFARQQIAFYASTPSYRAVLAQHGWEQTGEELSALASRGRWAELPGLISDEMLAEIGVEAPPQQLRQLLSQRYASLADRITLYRPFQPGETFWQQFISPQTFTNP